MPKPWTSIAPSLEKKIPLDFTIEEHVGEFLLHWVV